MEENNSTGVHATPVLWKDIWWIRSIVGLLLSAFCYSSYKGLVIIVRLLVTWFSGIKNVCAKFRVSASVSALTVNGDSQVAGERAAINQTEILEKREDDLGKFYDLAKELKSPNNSNMSLYNREYRQRMRSTVTESNLVSMVRQCQRSEPPAFPKFDETFIKTDEEKFNMTREQRFCSGDRRFRGNAFHSRSRLSTVPEEDTMESATESRASCKSEQNAFKNGYSNVTMKKGNEIVKGKMDQPSKESNIFSRSSTECHYERDCTGKGFKASNSKTFDENNNLRQCNNQVISPSCPSLVTDKFSTKHIQLSSTSLSCPICKSLCHCLCKNCDALWVLECQKDDSARSLNRDHYETNTEHEDLPEIGDGFIDDNFEDMESIGSS